jgi:putative isomerase
LWQLPAYIWQAIATLPNKTHQSKNNSAILQRQSSFLPGLHRRNSSPILLVLILIGCLFTTTSCTPNTVLQTTPDHTRSKYLIDALDPASWSGITMVDTTKNIMAFRFATYAMISDSVVLTSGKEKDYEVSYFNNGDTLYHSVVKVDFKASDGSYASLQWQTADQLWYLQWARPLENGVFGKLERKNNTGKVLNGNGILVEFFNPWAEGETYYLSDDTIKCTSGNFYAMFDKSPTYIIASADSLIRREELMQLLKSENRQEQITEGKFLYLFFENAADVSFKGWMDDARMNTIAYEDFDRLLTQSREAGLAKRPTLTGPYPDVISAIADNLNWMINYIPDTGLVYIPAGRTWDWGGWAVFAWDSFFNSLLMSLDNPHMAKENLRATYFAQYPNGNIPNYHCGDSGSDTHSQKTIGSYLVWKVYQKTGDRDFLAWNYEPLKKWHYWWREEVATGNPRRDGNNSGLFEWGADQIKGREDQIGRLQAMYESGRDDSPAFDNVTYMPQTWTINMSGVDINSCQALDARYLALIARELGHDDDEEIFLEEYRRLSSLMNEKMWNDQTGMYHDLFWDGTFSDNMDPSNFFPMLAGIASEERAERMIETLTDTTKFWGKYIIPTVSRDNPVFPEQHYWRGSSWPPTNYLIYQGLKKYRYDQLAAEYAWKSMEMVMKNYRNSGGCYEHYDTRTGHGMGQKFQSWGPLYIMLFIEEFIDYETGEGLRVGTFMPEPMILDNIVLRNQNYRIETGNGLKVSINNKKAIESDVPVVIRNLVMDNNSVSCEILALHDGEIEFVQLRRKVQLKKGFNNVSITSAK